MLKRLIYISALFLAGAFIAISCKKDDKAPETTTETRLAGTLTIQVDNTIQPIVEDVLAVFQSVYPKAKITQVNRNEADIVNALLNDSANIAVLSRKLTEAEEAHFTKKNIVPRITHFATDALALVASKQAIDTVASLQEVYRIMKGEDVSSSRQLVFDNANSGTVRLLMEKAGVAKIPLKNVYSLKNTAEVLNFVKNNPQAIGVIGVNLLTQTPPELAEAAQAVRVLGVNTVKNGVEGKKYFKPSQSDIASGDYPLTRELYILNYQGREGLGMGFAIYTSAPEGQRIILKSGLVPVEIPPREIEIRND